jgi:hypothetical protein
MEKILLSSLVGVVTYFVLSAGTQFSNSKIEVFNLKGGGEQVDPKNNCDIFPECFMISDHAKRIFEHLQKRGKCGTQEYQDLGLLYSKIFCFEIALGNNPNHPNHIEEEKVRQLLTNYDGVYGVKLIKVENNIVEIVKSPDFIKNFITDINNNAKIALDKLSLTDEFHKLHEEMIVKHEKNIQELYDNLNIN